MVAIIRSLGYPPCSTGFWIRCFSRNLTLQKTCLFRYFLRIAISNRKFTAANTGLDKASHYPELGSAFKAAFVKSCSWFFAAKAVELSEANPQESRLQHGAAFLQFFPLIVSGKLYLIWCMVRAMPFYHGVATQDGVLHLISTCIWNFHHAIVTMDHAGIICLEQEAQAIGWP